MVSPTQQIAVPLVFNWVGEHAVVFDKRAVGQVLPNLQLRLFYPVVSQQQEIPEPLISLVELFFTQLKERMPDVDLGEVPRFSVDLEAELVGVGLGVSAALFVALGYLLGRFAKNLDYEILRQLIIDLEEEVHGKSSGIDQYLVCQKPGLYRFQAGDGMHLLPGFPLPFVLLNSGRTESTKELIGHVQHHWQTNRSRVFNLVRKIGKLSYSFIEAIHQRHDQDLLQLMQRNQECLTELGVVSADVQEFFKRLNAFGIVGKVSGAGGVAGGSGVLVVVFENHQQYSTIRMTAEQFGYKIAYRSQETEGFYV